MYKITLIKDGVSSDITDMVGEISWSEDMDSVGLSLSFSVPDSEERYIPQLLIMAGDIISVSNDEGELIKAVVVSVTRNFPKRNVKAYDFGFYLNKNDIVIQFKDKSVSDCLRELFGKVNIPVGEICDMPAKVNGVYIKNVNEVIKELIEIQQGNDGKKYYYELRGDKIFVFQLPEEPIEYIFKPAVNVAAFDVTQRDAHSRGQYTHSIENMKNRVTAIINSKTTGNMPAVEFTVSDDENIKKYGLLSENYSVNSEDLDNIKSLAKNELTDKNKLKRELTMDFIGHDSARPGRVMHIIDDFLGIDDFFRIQSVNHKVNGDIHTMSCTLNFLKENTSSNFTESKVIQREDVSSSGNGSAVSSGGFGKLSSILNAQVGKPYVWGAEGPDSFDCSGLVCYAFNQSGVKSIGRTTAQGYYNMCTKISASNRQPGDLVFWADNGKVYHVGVYIGDGIQKFCPTCKTRPTDDPTSFGFRMINAENPNVGVRKTKLWSNVYAYGRL